MNHNPNPNYWLLGTTSTFIFPILYSYRKKHYILSFSSLLALAGSLRYWKNPEIAYNRNIDVITSRLSLISYVYYGFFNIHPFNSFILGYFNLSMIYRFYYLSCKTYEKNDVNWINYHMFFHLYTTLSKIYVIYWI